MVTLLNSSVLDEIRHTNRLHNSGTEEVLRAIKEKRVYVNIFRTSSAMRSN